MGKIEETSQQPGSTLNLSSSIQTIGPVLLRVAWISIGLGLLMEALLIGLAVALGTNSEARTFLAELTQKITWSVVVCVGLAIGVLASKSQPAFAGLLGLLAAPAGFEIARAVHRGAGEALQIAGANPSAVSPFVLAGIKAVEYGLLGLLLGWVSRRSSRTIRAHVALGLACGLVFGGGILALTAASVDKPLSEVAILSWAINELLFPVGCSLIIYVTGIFEPTPRASPDS